MDVETELAELGKRVATLEAGAKTDIPALKRDLRRVLSLQDDALEQLEELNRRVAANELIATANARATEVGFANVQAQISGLDMRVDGLDSRIDGLDSRIGGLDSRIGGVETQLSALRRDLPGMMAETMREVLKEQRRG